jgi:hypothetical protein
VNKSGKILKIRRFALFEFKVRHYINGLSVDSAETAQGISQTGEYPIRWVYQKISSLCPRASGNKKDLHSS